MIIIQKKFTSTGSNGWSTKEEVLGKNELLSDKDVTAAVPNMKDEKAKMPVTVTAATEGEYRSEEIPRDSHQEVLDFFKKGTEKANAERREDELKKSQQEAVLPLKPHERTAVHAVDPAKKDEMINAHKKHSMEEAAQKTVDNLKKNNWKLGIDTLPSEKETSSETPEITEKVTSKITTSSTSKTPTTVEKSVEQVISEEPSKEGLSTGAKAGLAAAGVATAGAVGYAAYKAWKKRKARKAAVDAEVDEFLNKFKTEK